jgi:hypothetical protein
MTHRFSRAAVMCRRSIGLAETESGVEADMLHADDLLAFMRGDGVPECHGIGRQVQFVGVGRGSPSGNGSARIGTGSSSRWKMVRCTVHRNGCGRASISSQDVPGKRTRRSLTDSPGRSKLLTGERRRGVAGSGIGLNAAHYDASPHLAPQPPQLGLKRIQLGTGNGDHVRCFDAHTRLPWVDASP